MEKKVHDSNCRCEYCLDDKLMYYPHSFDCGQEPHVRQFSTCDGRRGEYHIQEKKSEDCEVLRETEVYEEDRPMVLRKRIAEKVKPRVIERTVETLDAAGAVVDTCVEQIDNELSRKCSCLSEERIAQIVRGLVADTPVKVMSEPKVSAMSTLEGRNKEADYGWLDWVLGGTALALFVLAIMLVVVRGAMALM